MIIIIAFLRTRFPYLYLSNRTVYFIIREPEVRKWLSYPWLELSNHPHMMRNNREIQGVVNQKGPPYKSSHIFYHSIYRSTYLYLFVNLLHLWQRRKQCHQELLQIIKFTETYKVHFVWNILFISMG